MTDRAAQTAVTGIPVRIDRWTIAICAVGIVAVGAILGFDLGSPVAMNDDWLYRWSAGQLAGGHGFRIMPDQSAYAIVQIAWGAILTFGHTDERLLRLTVMPVVLLGALATIGISVRLGATRFWALVAGTTFIASPLFAAQSSSFMTDTFYAGLLMAAMAAGVMWAEDGRLRLVCIGLTVLACLERQHGFGVGFAVATGLLTSGRLRRRRSEPYLLAMLVLAVLAAEAGPLMTGLGSRNEALRYADALRPAIPYAIFAVLYLPVLIGLTLVPFAVGMWTSSVARAKSPTKRHVGPLVSFGLASVGLTVSAAMIATGHIIFPGDNLSTTGLMPAHLFGPKVQLFQGWRLVPLELAAIVAFMGLLGRHARHWIPGSVKPAELMLVVLSLTQILPMVQTGYLDRYYIPVLVPLLPIGALLASGDEGQRIARFWAIASLCALIGLYVAGEQDYQAWQTARDSAERSFLSTHSAAEINGGWEANAVYWETPYFETHGVPPGAVLTDVRAAPSMLGSPTASYVLLFSAGRPDCAFPYRSLASGCILIVHFR